MPGEPPLHSPVEDKIAWASLFYQRNGEGLLRDDIILDLLGRLKDAIHASRAEMVRAGIVNECKTCEETESGSCCGKGIENRYSPTLLLINVLLGQDLPDKRTAENNCFFLGSKGCTLLARHVICVNYLCKKVSDRINPLKIASLREKEGEELTLLFLLNEEVRKRIRGCW
ncbi:MAG: hypothetical protein ABII06_08350 [Pseudomonadota bacterium]